MLAAIHEDLPEAVNVALKQEEDMRVILHDSPRVGRDARNSGWQAIRLRIVLGLPLVHDRFPCRQQRNRFAWSQTLREIADLAATVPYAA
jgi:hypothetical protein